MKTFLLLALALPSFLAVDLDAAIDETSASPATTVTTATAPVFATDASHVRVELPAFDRAIRARVEAAARAASETAPVTLPAPTLDVPASLETAPAAAAGRTATLSNPAPATTTAAHPKEHRAPLHVAGL